MKKVIAFFLYIFLLPIMVSAQEVLFDLDGNTALKKYLSEHKEKSFRKKAVVEPLSLPFRENFRQKGVYPDQSKFIDSNVFVSNTWAYRSPDRGTATFDALDKFGNIYKNASINSFIADYLTSRKINTTVDVSGEKTDSLSFFFQYQPQGRGIAPEEKDSLVLQFLADSTIVGGKSDSTWVTVWRSKGYTLNEFHKYLKEIKLQKDTNFGQVRIDLNRLKDEGKSESVFFHEKFRFRFFNYASLATPTNPTLRSNVDQWHIDLIYLDAYGLNRRFGFKELAFSEAPSTFLRDGYQAVPYQQYVNGVNTFRSKSFENYISNLDTLEALTHYKYTVRTAGKSDLYATYDGENANLKPFFEDGFQKEEAHAKPDTYPDKNNPAPPYPTTGISEDTVSFFIKHTVENVGGTLKSDEVSYHQYMYNYYAFDKGVPEKGYGIIGVGTAAAVKFQITKADSLQGAFMLFNRTAGNANEDLFFDLVLWKDNGFGTGPSPRAADQITLIRSQRPKWDSENIYHFVDFQMPKGLYLTPGTYYIGWVNQNDGALNVGFDTYINNKERNYVRVNNIWQGSSFEGSVMIRPIVGKKYPITGINYPNELANQTLIYPNPVSKMLNIVLPDDLNNRKETLSLRITNVVGQTVLEQRCEDHIEVSSLEKGMYILTFIDRLNNTSFSKKLMVTK
ncbi:MAG: T9SS type A sorting domain-containing protein [Bacteroidales bacterium]